MIFNRKIENLSIYYNFCIKITVEEILCYNQWSFNKRTRYMYPDPQIGDIADCMFLALKQWRAFLVFNLDLGVPVDGLGYGVLNF